MAQIIIWKSKSWYFGIQEIDRVCLDSIEDLRNYSHFHCRENSERLFVFLVENQVSKDLDIAIQKLGLTLGKFDISEGC